MFACVNSFCDCDAPFTACFLCRCSQELTLAANRFTVLPDYVTTFTKLKRLVVDTNFYEKLPEGIGQLQQLSFLCCSRNRITHLPESIVKLTKLKTLSVYQNRLGDRGIPDCICDMGNLRELQLSYNSISRLPYRFTTGSIMSSLRRLWLFGNCFFDVGDLPIRLKAVRDLRLDNNPLKSPPVRYTAGQIPALLEYTSTRISRIREVQRRCEAEGWVVEPTRLVPTVARDGHLVISGYGTLNEEELTAFDQVVEQCVPFSTILSESSHLVATLLRAGTLTVTSTRATLT